MGQETVVTPSVTVTESYESNALFNEEGEDDWASVTVISPQISFARKYAKGTLSGSIGAGLEYFTGRSELNNERYSAKLNFDLRSTSKTTFAFTEHFSLSQDTLSLSEDSLSDTGTVIQLERDDILFNFLALSVNHSLSPAVSTGLTLSDSRTEYESSSLFDIRSNSIIPVISLDKALTPKTSLNGSYDFTRFYSEKDGEEESKDAHSLLVGFNHRFFPNLSFEMSGGVVYTPEKGFHYDVIGDAGLSRSTKRSQMSLKYSRRVDATSGLTSDLGISQGLSFNIASTLTRYFSLSLDAGIYSNKSETSDGVDLLSYNAGISGVWQPYTWMSVGAGYSHFQQESDGTEGEDLTRDTFFLSINVIPVVWRL